MQKKLLWKKDHLCMTSYRRGDRNKTMDFKCESSSVWIRERGQLHKFIPISEKEANTENTDISRVNYYVSK